MRSMLLLVTLFFVVSFVGCGGNGGGSGSSPAISLAQKIYESTGMRMNYNDVLSQVAQQYADEWKNDPPAYSSHGSDTIIADVKTIDPTYGDSLTSAAEESKKGTAEEMGNADLAWENHFKNVDYSGYDDYGCGFTYTDCDFGGGGGMKRYYFWVVILASRD